VGFILVVAKNGPKVDIEAKIIDAESKAPSKLPVLNFSLLSRFHLAGRHKAFARR